jgi:hypothetical protein
MSYDAEIGSLIYSSHHIGLDRIYPARERTTEFTAFELEALTDTLARQLQKILLMDKDLHR